MTRAVLSPGLIAFLNRFALARPPGPAKGGRLWIDITDLAHYFEHHRFPTGIQRTCLSILREIAAEPQWRDRCGLLFLDVDHRRWIAVSWQSLDALGSNMTADHGGEEPPAGPNGGGRAERLLRRLLAGLPADLREPLLAALLHYYLFTLQLLRRLRPGRRPAQPIQAAQPAQPDPAAEKPVVQVPAETRLQPGDVLLNATSPWWNPDYLEMVAELQKQQGVLFTSMIYDVLPAKFPEWFTRWFRSRFMAWLEHDIVQSRMIFTISQSTRRDLQELMAKAGLPDRPISVLRLGDDIVPAAAAPELPTRFGLGDGRPYVLIVCSLEPRKNHQLLLWVWKDLVRRYGDGAPRLVMVGKPSWLVDDLMAQLAGSGGFDGAIRVLADVNDRELAALYHHCLFTVYPSFHEGWGLPVAESLKAGKLCIASDTSSMPEIAGSLIPYLSPWDWRPWAEMVVHYWRDPEALRAAEDRIRREFRLTPWRDTTAQLFAALDEDLSRSAGQAAG